MYMGVRRGQVGHFSRDFAHIDSEGLGFFVFIESRDFDFNQIDIKN